MDEKDKDKRKKEKLIWKPLKGDIVPNNIPVLVYVHNKGDWYMCVAKYDPKTDLFLVIPQYPKDGLLRVSPDAWMELPCSPGLPPKNNTK